MKSETQTLFCSAPTQIRNHVDCTTLDCPRCQCESESERGKATKAPPDECCEDLPMEIRILKVRHHERSSVEGSRVEFLLKTDQPRAHVFHGLVQPLVRSRVYRSWLSLGMMVASSICCTSTTISCVMRSAVSAERWRGVKDDLEPRTAASCSRNSLQRVLESCREHDKAWPYDPACGAPLERLP